MIQSTSMAMRQVIRKLLKNIKPAMYTSSVLLAHCTSSESEEPSENKKLKLDIPDISKLTHQYMIKQSALDAANSATQALTVTHGAITNLSTEYRILLNELISLFEETLVYNINDEHWDLIVEMRNKMQVKKKEIIDLRTYMDNVKELMEVASRLSILCGMDDLTDTLNQRLHDTLHKVKVEIDSNVQLEQIYWRIQERCVENSKQTKNKK